jgi:hypothetical protein
MGEKDKSYGFVGGVVVATMVAIVPFALYKLLSAERCVIPAASGIAFLALTALTLVASLSLVFLKWPPGRGLARGMIGGYFIGVLLNGMWLSGGCD